MRNRPDAPVPGTLVLKIFTDARASGTKAVSRTIPVDRADCSRRVDRGLRRQGPAEACEKGQYQRADGSHSLSKPVARGKLRR